jgi:MarR family transcriptional regulator, transcriptional regulator for hemolysin
MSDRLPSFEYSMLSTGRSVRRAYDAYLGHLNLNFSEARVLAVIFREGPMPQRQLADRLEIQKAAMGTIIDRLERQGLVLRASDADDRRVWRIALTGKARRLIPTLDEVEDQVRAHLRHGISEADRLRFTALVHVINQNAIDALAEAERWRARTAGLEELVGDARRQL